MPPPTLPPSVLVVLVILLAVALLLWLAFLLAGDRLFPRWFPVFLSTYTGIAGGVCVILSFISGEICVRSLRVSISTNPIWYWTLLLFFTGIVCLFLIPGATALMRIIRAGRSSQG